MSHLSLIKNYHSVIYLHDLNLYYQPDSLSINGLIEQREEEQVILHSYDT